MRTTRYGEPSDREIDALRHPPSCECGQAVESFGDSCEDCHNQQTNTSMNEIQLSNAEFNSLMNGHNQERVEHFLKTIPGQTRMALAIVGIEVAKNNPRKVAVVKTMEGYPDLREITRQLKQLA